MYNTDSQVPADTEFPIKVQLLQIHKVGVHKVGSFGQDCAQHGMEVNAEIVHVDSDAPTMTKQKDEVNDSFVGDNTDITDTTIAELECPYANCHYVTRVGKDCVKCGMEMYAATYMQNELKCHLAAKHAVYGDATGTTDPKGWNKSSGRSNKSKKRNKSRRHNVESSNKVWDMLFYDGGTQLC